LNLSLLLVGKIQALHMKHFWGLSCSFDVCVQDNVFVTVVASVQFRAHVETAEDAFYKLTNPREQIKSYVFDVVRASVPRMILDDVFEQKNEIAKSVEEELEKVNFLLITQIFFLALPVRTDVVFHLVPCFEKCSLRVAVNCDEFIFGTFTEHLLFELLLV
jgi:hypothetical protein